MTFIAICDDDAGAANKLETILLELQLELQQDFQIDLFQSGEKLIQTFEDTTVPDIVFLDIEMPEVDGIQTGHKIRSIMRNKNPVIIYISSYNQYHIELYPIKPSAFIPKPPDPAAVKHAMIMALEELRQKSEVFVYQKGQQIVRAWKSDIYYFESIGKNVRMVTRIGEDFFRMSFEMLLKQLNGDSDYQLVHRSFIVNLNTMATFSRDKIHYPNKDIVPISAKRVKGVKAALIQNVKKHQPAAFH